VKLSECRMCELCNTRTKVVCGVGTGQSGIMLVGEAPGRTEDVEGTPFVGKAGRYLRENIKGFWAGKPEFLYITNVVKCWPANEGGAGNRVPTPHEIETCGVWLKKEIETLTPVIIIPLGNTALQAITGEEGISTKHGQIAWSSEYHCCIFPMYHPSFILRTQSHAAFAKDVAILGEIVNRPWHEVETWLKAKVRI